MAGHIEKKEVIYILLIVSFVLGVVYFYKGQYFMNDFLRASGQTRATVMPTNRTQVNQQFQKQIEASLNDLLGDVFLEMHEYRKRRKMLAEIVQPKNLRDASMINETYAIGLTTISDLRSRTQNIIAIFSRKESEIQELIKGRSASAQKNILNAWSKVKREQVDLYVNYFSMEQQILQRYEQLLKLYQQNRNDVVYYADAGSIAFQTQGLNVQASQLNQSIRALMEQQAKLTK